MSGEIFQVRGTLYRWREYRQTGMGKSLFIAEKPSVAQEFAKALGESMTRHDGYQESENLLVTWCVGHLITMSYPDAYDERYKKWSLDTLPFLPDHFLYETIPSSRKQFGIVKHLLNRPDVETIYVCTDSGREGEYIYRLVRQEAGVKGKKEKRVWIDSQTEEEIRRGIREAKDLSAYDNLSAAAYLRAKEDYLMGINFSRALTLKYGSSMASFLGERYCVISVGRVMTCVLGMVVRREREIRDFKETPFYRVLARVSTGGIPFHAEWRSVEGSRYYQSPKLYKENGFRSREDAEQLIRTLTEKEPLQAALVSIEKKKEKKNPPLLYNLAELQNDCSRLFRISPDQTLNIVQDLYEKKLVTYPRTDARVLSSAIAKVIGQNLSGLKNFGPASAFAEEALQSGSWKTIAKTRYVDDKQITDHYALIPTGQGLGALKGLSSTAFGVYCTIVKRFLGIFYPPAVYRRISLVLDSSGEKFFASFRILEEEGYLSVMKESGKKKEDSAEVSREEAAGVPREQAELPDGQQEQSGAGEWNPELLSALEKLRKGAVLPVSGFEIREGKTSPPKRYNSGSMILAMENAGQLIEDEELREQIKSCGIGTSATRAEILKKLVANRYIQLNSKTQILTPTLMGEMIYDVVLRSIRSLLNPELTASWEKGLNYVAEGSITSAEYMEKLSAFINRWTNGVRQAGNQSQLLPCYQNAARFYKARTVSGQAAGKSRRGRAAGAAGKRRQKAAETED